MSRHKIGNCHLDCSVEVLRQALINQFPEWEDHIAMDPQGRYGLRAWRQSDSRDTGYHIVVPGSQGAGALPPIVDLQDRDKLIASGMSPEEALKKARRISTPTKNKLSWADMGFKQNADKTWEINVDSHGFSGNKLSNVKITPDEMENLGGEGEPTVESAKFIKVLSAEVQYLRMKQLVKDLAAQGIKIEVVKESNTDGEANIVFDIGVADMESLVASY